LYAANLYFDGQVPAEPAERDERTRRLVEQALAADAQNPWALNYYGWLYRSGRGVARDDAKAAVYFESSQKLGYLQAAVNLGSMRRLGEGVPKDFAIAASLFDDACRRSYVSGCTELADMKFDGDGFERTPQVLSEAAGLVDKALALNGEDRFAIELKAYATRYGYGAPADPVLAEAHFRKAGAMGSLWAWYQLGNMLRDQATALKDQAQGDMYGRALAAFEEGIGRGDSWSMVGKAALILDGAVSTGQDARVEVPALLARPDSEGIVAAFDLLIRLYTTDIYGEPDRQAALPVIRRMIEKATPEAKRWLAFLVTNGTLYLPPDPGLTIHPPWEYFAACGELGWASCYGEAGDSLLAAPTRGDAISEGEAAGLYTALRGQPAVDLALSYYQKGADGGDARSRLAIATRKLADGSPLANAEAKTLFGSLQREGQEVGTVGLVVAGIEDGRPMVDFQAAFGAVRGMTVSCIQNQSVFPGVETAYWPGFGCGRGDFMWSNWTMGLAETRSRLNLRSQPGGPVVGELAAQTPLVFLQYSQDEAKGWLKVHTPADQIGWVKASYLIPWQDRSAHQ
ncbi:MAG: SH3 domain-containing protein, partial [Rhizobiaceae bacterium]|nr:SH3 domain-containing protein [Rhizobiaceae bacterium]